MRNAAPEAVSTHHRFPAAAGRLTLHVPASRPFGPAKMPRLDVHLTPGNAHSHSHSHSHLAVVIDVLRASTTIVTALTHGATAILPVRTIAEAKKAARAIGPTALLAGERHALKIPGFSLGNSPLEFTRATVHGRPLILTTTNGTKALLSAQRTSRDVIVGSYVNFSVVLASVRSALRRGLDVAIVCAGSGGACSLEDTACAGRFVRLALRGLKARQATVLNDAARAALLIEKPYGQDLARLFQHASHGRTLRDAGFARDLAACRALDACPVVPRLVGCALRAQPARRGARR